MSSAARVAPARCAKHGMIEGTCAFCSPPRVANVPVKRKATPHATAVLPATDFTGLVVIHTQGEEKAANLDAINEHTRIVHICGLPFLWAIEEILKRGTNLRTIQVIPSMLAKCHPNSHLRLCRERGVEIRAGHIRPEGIWQDTRMPRHYEAQRRFLATLSGPQKDLFDELLALGFEPAIMAKRYFCLGGEEPIPQRVLAREYGLGEANNMHVSAAILAVLFYLDDSVSVGEGSQRRARNMRARVERLRPYVASAEHRRRLVEEFGLTTLAADFPMARAETLRAILTAKRNGRLRELHVRDPRAYEALVWRFGLDELERGVYRILAEVGEKLGGVTRERARQLEERALELLGIEED